MNAPHGLRVVALSTAATAALAFSTNNQPGTIRDQRPRPGWFLQRSAPDLGGRLIVRPAAVAVRLSPETCPRAAVRACVGVRAAVRGRHAVRRVEQTMG